jgi:hypothetical protein
MSLQAMALQLNSHNQGDNAMTKTLMSILVVALLAVTPYVCDWAYSQPPPEQEEPIGPPPPPGERREAVREIQHRIDRHQTRIDEGVRSGALTRREKRAAQSDLDRIEREYRAAMASGRLGPGEVDRLNRMLDENSRLIRIEKHNLPVRPRY